MPCSNSWTASGLTDYGHASTLAAGLREAVTTAWRHKLANAGRNDTAAKVYDYIATGGFADRYAAAERALDAQLETLRKEKRYYTHSWAQREQQIDKTRANLTGIVADLIRIGAELPSTAIAELPAADLARSTACKRPCAAISSRVTGPGHITIGQQSRQRRPPLRSFRVGGGWLMSDVVSGRRTLIGEADRRCARAKGTTLLLLEAGVTCWRPPGWRPGWSLT